MGAGRISPHPKKGLRTGASLGFLDEVGFSDRPNVRRTWSKKGKTPIVKTAGGWKNRTLIGMVVTDPKGKRKPKLFAMIRKQGVKSHDIIMYVKSVRHHFLRKKLILLWDGLTAHTSKLTQEFIKTQSSWLTVERMPTYAPELNPPEHVWSAMKAKDMGNIHVETPDELDRHIERSLRRIRRSRTILRGCVRSSGLFKC